MQRRRWRRVILQVGTLELGKIGSLYIFCYYLLEIRTDDHVGALVGGTDGAEAEEETPRNGGLKVGRSSPDKQQALGSVVNTHQALGSGGKTLMALCDTTWETDTHILFFQAASLTYPHDAELSFEDDNPSGGDFRLDNQVLLGEEEAPNPWAGGCGAGLGDRVGGY